MSTLGQDEWGGGIIVDLRWGDEGRLLLGMDDYCLKSVTVDRDSGRMVGEVVTVGARQPSIVTSVTVTEGACYSITFNNHVTIRDLNTGRTEVWKPDPLGTRTREHHHSGRCDMSGVRER